MKNICSNIKKIFIDMTIVFIFNNDAILEKLSTFGPYTDKTSNEWEISDGNHYHLYFYHYNIKKNRLYFNFGGGDEDINYKNLINEVDDVFQNPFRIFYL